MTNPRLLTIPFADTGTKNEIPVSGAIEPQLATFQAGFPVITQQKIADGGIPPERADFNGILNIYGQHIVHLNKGIPYEFDQDFANAIGGYPLHARIMLSDGQVVQNTENANTNNPNVDMTDWKISNGTIDFYDFSDLRSYKGGGVVCYVAKDGIAGHFLLSSDTTTADNNGTVIVDAKNRRWKRSFDGSYQIKWFDVKPDSTENSTTKINNAIDFISNLPVPENGNVLEFDSGIYYANLVAKPRVRFHGKGINTTIIKAVANSTTPVLYADANIAFFGWQDISFDGNKQNGATGKGVFLDHAQSGDITASKITDKSATGGAPYRYNTSSNFSVSNCKDNGIHIGTGTYGNYAIMWSDFHSVYNDGHGFYNSSTDNLFYSFYAERNGLCGLYNVGANNKFIGVKTIWNGVKNVDSAGTYSIANRCDLIAVESQDNFCNGMIISGDDCVYDVLIDCNGYSPAGGSNVSSRVSTGLDVRSGARQRIRARITNYKGGRLGDGFYALEYPYKIDSESSFDEFDVTVSNACTNKPPVGAITPSSLSSPVVSNRNSSVVVGSTTYTKDQPIIIQNQGLQINPSESVEIVGSVKIGSMLSYAFEFEYKSSSYSAPRLIKSKDGKFIIYLIKTGATDAPYIQTTINVGGTDFSAVFKGAGLDAFDVADIRDGLRVLVKGNLTLTGSRLVRDESVCFIDANGLIKNIQRRQLLGCTETVFGDFSGFVVSEDALQSWQGKVRGFAFFGGKEGQSVDLGQYVSSSAVSKYRDCGGIYADFLDYNTSKFINDPRLNAPTPSESYRGMRLQKLGGAGIADIDQICAKGTDNLYTWKSVY